MKGISPMIATVLLIAFTVAVGGIVSIWLTGFTRTTTSSVSAGTESQTKCAATYLDLKVYSSTNRTTITNMGDQPVNLTSFFYSDGTVVTIKSANKNLAAGSSISLTLTSTNDVETASPILGNTSITVNGLCLNAVPKSASCSSTEDCWY